jgi:hypothetical protein
VGATDLSETISNNDGAEDSTRGSSVGKEDSPVLMGGDVTKGEEGGGDTPGSKQAGSSQQSESSQSIVPSPS